MWKPEKYQTFDWETSGTKPEYALQPWRVPQGKAWGTSFVAMRIEDGNPIYSGGLLDSEDQPHNIDNVRYVLKVFLQEALHAKRTLIGWNVAFDIAWLIAYGFEELALQQTYMDGMLLWRHCYGEPEYETDRAHRKSYGLKAFVREYLPEAAGYEEDIDFHDRSPEARKALHKYNKQDNLYTYIGAKHFWEQLEPQQRMAAKIEACMLPLVALSNFRGLAVDTLASRDLAFRLVKNAEEELDKLKWQGVTETIVRSPVQLSKLMYDEWKLPVLKINKSKKTGNTTRSTDKEVLHELSFMDDRAKWIRYYREALNNKTKFADALTKSAEYNGDNRTHPIAIPLGTYTGRLTYNSGQKARGPGARPGTEKDVILPIGFALHQMKGVRKKEDAYFRGQIIAPEGYTLLEFDAAGQEYRWMAIQSNDPVMLQLCLPGEDPHSFMGSRIGHEDYHEVMRLKETDEAMKLLRKAGKVSNLCVAEGTLVLTDRGVCSIEQVQLDDKIWDGHEFVSHDGVSFSGEREVMTYAGLTATPEHGVLVDGEWSELQEAARHGWRVEPALGKGRARKCWAAVRIMDGLIRRAVSEAWRTLRAGAMRLRRRAGDVPEHAGEQEVDPVQRVRGAAEASARGQADYRNCIRQKAPKARHVDVSTLPQPERPLVSQLRRSRDRMQVWFGGRGGDVYKGSVAAPNIPQAGHRPRGQRWSLRAWKLALGYTQGEPCQQKKVRTYDIVNCGPRTRFAANGLIVHNSLQFRTYPKRLRTTARVDYGMNMELPEAEMIWATYQRTYKGVPVYWQKSISKVRRLGYAETLGGRRVQVTGNWNGGDTWKMESTAINFPIQGTGACQKCLAIACVADYLPTVSGYFGWDLHDGLFFFIPDRYAMKAAVDIKRILDTLPYEKAWGFNPPIPLPFDVKMGPSWGALHEVKFE